MVWVEKQAPNPGNKILENNKQCESNIENNDWKKSQIVYDLWTP